MQKLGLVLIVTAIAGVTGGCSADGGKNDPGRSAQTLSAAPTPAAAPSSTLAPPPAPAAADARPVIVCFGDSITAGLGLDYSASYPADLQHALDAAGYRYRVVNMGVSGDTTKDGLARVARVLALKPEWVVVEFGGNDGLRGLPVSDAQANLAAMVSALRRGGMRVLLAGISLPAQYGPEYVSRFNAMYPAVAKQTGVPLYPFVYKGVYGVPGFIQDDGVHPTADGAVQIARNIGGALMPMLKR